MYILKNAFRCIGRSKGRNVLIGIIVFIIALSACIGLSIRRSAEKAKTETLNSMSVTATISFDRRAAMELLKSVGLSEDEANRRVLLLSGGQQQRVAIARAISYDPDIILADEPTGNLDTETQNEIMEIFRRLANEGKCVILVSHSPEVAKMCDVRYVLERKKT